LTSFDDDVSISMTGFDDDDDVSVSVKVTMTGLVSIYISGGKEGERKGGWSLLPVGTGEYKESDLPLGWSL
jgi:hypothetical protein